MAPLTNLMTILRRQSGLAKRLDTPCHLGGEYVAAADRRSKGQEGIHERRPAAQANRSFRRQYSATRCRNGVPHPVGGGRAAPEAPAGRRNRDPQDVDPVSA